jgi:uncharacterized membrane protein YdjX (TVP38/TMEM64 family)
VAAKNEYLKKAAKAVIALAVIVILVFLVKEIISDAESITSIAASVGALGPIVLILLISLGIIFTPIPCYILTVAAGYLYGTVAGGIYSYIAHLIAATGSFAAIKIYHKFNGTTSSKKYPKYKKMVKEHKNMLYLLYGIPLLPMSFVSYLAVHAKVTWKEFFKIAIFSFLPPVIIFSYFGNRLSSKNLVEIVVLMAVIGFIAYLAVHYIKQQKNGKQTNKLK